MDVVPFDIARGVSSGSPNKQIAINNLNYQKNVVVINASFSEDSGDKVNTSVNDIYKNLTITAEKILDKLNEILKPSGAGDIRDIDPEQYTPEKTADRIVSGIASLYESYKKQNPKLSNEELITSFMELARNGVKSGYEDASSILENIGAFKFEGIKEGVEATKAFLDTKLAAFESQKRKDLGLEPGVVSDTILQTSNELLTGAGARLVG